ncbi:MAG: hypothetical protein CBD58_04440 [bacterium TMED198]|nr:MAG: hypothetical protein CBD58_04440 [bacterium TMED198]
MISKRKQEERDARKKRIIAAALTVFDRLGIEKTTIGEIAEEAGFGKATLYYYYPSKDDVYIEIMITGWKSLWEEIEEATVTDKPPKKKIFEILQQVCKVVNNDKNLYKFLFTAPSFIQETEKLPWKTYQERLYSILQIIIDKGCSDGEFIDLKPSIIMQAIGGLFHEMVLGNKDTLSEKDFELMISNLLLNKS